MTSQSQHYPTNCSAGSYQPPSDFSYLSADSFQQQATPTELPVDSQPFSTNNEYSSNQISAQNDTNSYQASNLLDAFTDDSVETPETHLYNVLGSFPNIQAANATQDDTTHDNDVPMDSINDLLFHAPQQNNNFTLDDILEYIEPELNGNLMETDNETEAATMIPAATATPVTTGYETEAATMIPAATATHVTTGWAANQPTNPEVSLQPLFSVNYGQAVDAINQSPPRMESLSLQEQHGSSNMALFSIRPMNDDNEVTSTGYSGSPSNTPSPATVTAYFSNSSSPRGNILNVL